MARVRLLIGNQEQIVRLPKEVVFPDTVREVTVFRDGVRRIVVPTNAVWDDFFDAPGVDLEPRDQPKPQTREPF